MIINTTYYMSQCGILKKRGNLSYKQKLFSRKILYQFHNYFEQLYRYLNICIPILSSYSVFKKFYCFNPRPKVPRPRSFRAGHFPVQNRDDIHYSSPLRRNMANWTWGVKDGSIYYITPWVRKQTIPLPISPT